MAQLGRALVSGARGREFKSPRPDITLSQGKRLIHSICTLLLIIPTLALALSPARATEIKVLLNAFKDAPAVTIGGDHLREVLATGVTDVANGSVTFTAADAAATEAGAPAEHPNLLFPHTYEASGPVQVQAGSLTRTYRGRVTVTARPQIRVVNTLDLEDYLRGVVASEMPASFPPEALKAQAVAARTYTLVNLGRHTADTADLCDTVHCQAYKGVSAEHPATSAAVSATTGIVVTHQGRLLLTMYSSCCGGRTAPHPTLGNASAILDAPRTGGNPPTGGAPPTGGVPPTGGDYCTGSSRHRWEARVSQADFLEGLKVDDQPPLRKVSILERDASSRIRRLRVETDQQSKEVTGADFRWGLERHGVRSQLFELEADPETGDILVKGGGWGHGIGMCQWGASGMASAPHNKSFREILLHYYPGAALTTLPGSETATAASSRN